MNVDDIVNLDDAQLKEIFEHIDKTLGTQPAKKAKELTKDEIIKQILYTKEGQNALVDAMMQPLRKELEYHAVSRKQLIDKSSFLAKVKHLLKRIEGVE